MGERTEQGGRVSDDAPGTPVRPSRPSAFSRTDGSDAVPDDAPTTRFDPVGQEPPPSSPLDGFAADERPRRWPRRLLVTGLAVVVLGAAYVGASWGLAGRVPRGAEVSGVAIGGLDEDAAVARLEAELGPRAAEPVPVVARDVAGQLDPATAGLTFDAAATVEGLTGFDLAQPQRLWRQAVGVGATDPVTHVDDAAVQAALDGLAGPMSAAPVNAGIVFADGAPHLTDPADGWSLDREGAVAVLADGWLDAGGSALELPTRVDGPDVTAEDAQAVLTEVAERVTAAPVSVAVADRLAVLQPVDLAAASSFTVTDGELTLVVDGQALEQSVLAQLPDLLTESSDARFEFADDRPVIVPGTPGTSLDPASLAAAVTTAVTAQDRTAPVDLVEQDPEESTAELEALGITQVVSEFATPLTSEPRRTVNITNGASIISGTLVRPGETFSLTEALGPIDAAHGYVQAGAIVSGEHTDAWGGGLSQVSTTTYNAAYLAGFEDVEHTPHSEWFARYPEGREATIFTGVLDMQWRNTAPTGALVQAWVGGNQLHVRIWGTPYWTVESSTSARSNVVQPTTVYSQSPTCEPQSAGNPGFTVSVTRTISAEGVEPTSETHRWTYRPQNRVICGEEPSAETPAPTG